MSWITDLFNGSKPDDEGAAKKDGDKGEGAAEASSEQKQEKKGRAAFRAQLHLTDGRLNNSKLDLHFRVDDKAEMGLLKVYPDHLKQRVDGFGAAFTDAAGYVYSQMNPSSQQSFIKMCFGKQGHNYRLCRAPIQSNDFARSTWSYDNDKDDEDLEGFSLGKDEEYIVPLIKDALEEAPDLKVVSSPWSPPAFMKTNRMVRMGGHLKPEYYDRWAQMIVKYVLAYRKRGIHVNALTVQNEPDARQPWESCLMTSEEEADFAINHLKPALRQVGLGDVRVLVWDHNKDKVLERAEAELSTDGADAAIDGIAFHWYSGDHFEALREAISEFTGKTFYMTEGCEAYSADPHDDLAFAEHYAHDIIGDLTAGANGYIDWNILLDEAGGPNHASNYCSAPLMYDRANKHLEVKPAFSYIGHFSRYIKPGARVMLTSRASDAVEAVGAVNPDGERVLVLLNRRDADHDVQVHDDRSTCAFTVPAHSIGTLVWSPATTGVLDQAQPVTVQKAPVRPQQAVRPKKEAKRQKKAEEEEQKRIREERRKEERAAEKQSDKRTVVDRLTGKAPEPRVIKAPEEALPLDSSLTHVMAPIERKIVPPDPLIDEPQDTASPVRENTQVISPVKLTPVPGAPKVDERDLDINPEVTRVMRPIRTTNATTGDSDLKELASLQQATEQIPPVKGRIIKQSMPVASPVPHSELRAASHSAKTMKRQNRDKEEEGPRLALKDLVAQLFADDDTPDEPEGPSEGEKASSAPRKSGTAAGATAKAVQASPDGLAPIDPSELSGLKGRVNGTDASNKTASSAPSNDEDKGGQNGDGSDDALSKHDDGKGKSASSPASKTSDAGTSKKLAAEASKDAKKGAADDARSAKKASSSDKLKGQKAKRSDGAKKKPSSSSKKKAATKSGSSKGDRQTSSKGSASAPKKGSAPSADEKGGEGSTSKKGSATPKGKGSSASKSEASSKEPTSKGKKTTSKDEAKAEQTTSGKSSNASRAAKKKASGSKRGAKTSKSAQGKGAGASKGTSTKSAPKKESAVGKASSKADAEKKGSKGSPEAGSKKGSKGDAKGGKGGNASKEDVPSKGHDEASSKPDKDSSEKKTAEEVEKDHGTAVPSDKNDVESVSSEKSGEEPKPHADTPSSSAEPMSDVKDDLAQTLSSYSKTTKEVAEQASEAAKKGAEALNKTWKRMRSGIETISSKARNNERTRKRPTIRKVTRGSLSEAQGKKGHRD